PVAAIWLSAPSSSHGQNAAVGQGKASPVTAITTVKKINENGKPNRNRILVAPQVPSGPVNCRCIALRATCPSAATIVKGIQSVAMLIMWSGVEGLPGDVDSCRHREGHSPRGQPKQRHDRNAVCSLAPLLRGEGWGEGSVHRFGLADGPPHPDCFAIRPLPASGAR